MTNLWHLHLRLPPMATIIPTAMEPDQEVRIGIMDREEGSMKMTEGIEIRRGRGMIEQTRRKQCTFLVMEWHVLPLGMPLLVFAVICVNISMRCVSSLWLDSNADLLFNSNCTRYFW